MHIHKLLITDIINIHYIADFINTYYITMISIFQEAIIFSIIVANSSKSISPLPSASTSLMTSSQTFSSIF
jgi:hypothetical protein